MSPSESQLRAALHEGAGRGPDADLIIANAERYRRARRQRMTTVAAAAVVVAFVGVGGTVLALNGSDEQAGAGGGGRVAGAAPGAAASRHASSPQAPVVAAPASTSPHRPGGGYGADRAGVCPAASGPVGVPARGTDTSGFRLLPAHVAMIKACAYGSANESADRTAVFNGTKARGIATALNQASAVPAEATRSCAKVHDRGGRLALLATDAHGRRAKTVLVTVRCTQVVATNGTTARYPATLPSPLSRLLR